MTTISELTRQERTILSLVAKGWRNARIAGELVISIRTVENHLYHIFDKLGVSSRTEAALQALSTGLLIDIEMSGNADDNRPAKGYAPYININQEPAVPESYEQQIELCI